VEGFSGTTSVFHQQKFLYVESKTFSIHIQTDKSVYKPGDIVGYRILVLDADTKPIKIDEAIRVSIIDSGDDMLEQMLNVSAPHGGSRGDFQITEYHRFGVWFIEATYSYQVCNAHNILF
jgi:CD109 antigen